MTVFDVTTGLARKLARLHLTLLYGGIVNILLGYANGSPMERGDATYKLQ